METTGPAEGPGRKGRDEGFLAYQTVMAVAQRGLSQA